MQIKTTLNLHLLGWQGSDDFDKTWCQRHCGKQVLSAISSFPVKWYTTTREHSLVTSARIQLHVLSDLTIPLLELM